MALYESVIIARQDLGASQVNSIVEGLSTLVEANDGKVVRVDNWGLKNLAYRIKKNRKGHYVLLNLDIPTSFVIEYERNIRVNEDIIRYLTVRVEEFGEPMNGSAKSDIEADGTTSVQGEA
ncbi:MAG: 30S ribosomal protein S6 [Alphaproteobacteria bacterium]